MTATIIALTSLVTAATALVTNIATVIRLWRHVANHPPGTHVHVIPLPPNRDVPVTTGGAASSTVKDTATETPA